MYVSRFDCRNDWNVVKVKTTFHDSRFHCRSAKGLIGTFDTEVNYLTDIITQQRRVERNNTRYYIAGVFLATARPFIG